MLEEQLLFSTTYGVQVKGLPMYSGSVIADWQQIHFFSIDDFAECNIFVGEVPMECVTDAGKKVSVRHNCMEKCLEWIFLISSSGS